MIKVIFWIGRMDSLLRRNKLMIIYIDGTIKNLLEQRDFNESELLFFSELASSHRQGFNFLCGDTETLEKIRDSFQGVHRSIYNKIKSNHVNNRILIENVEKLLVISISKDIVAPDFIKERAVIIELETAIKYKIYSQCTLLSENLNDCKFYEILAKRYIFEKNLKEIQLSFHHESGGGNTTDTIFYKCAKHDKVLVFCIADSDQRHGRTKKFPNEPAKGETVNRLLKMEKKLETELEVKTYALYCISVQEVENMIPLEILKTFSFTIYPYIKEGVETLEKIKNSKYSNAYLYYDFKHGIEISNEKIPSQEYWTEVAKGIGCENFPKLNEKLLEKSISLLTNTYNTVEIDDVIKPIWNIVGKKLFSWGCANQPLRV